MKFAEIFSMSQISQLKLRQDQWMSQSGSSETHRILSADEHPSDAGIDIIRELRDLLELATDLDKQQKYMMKLSIGLRIIKNSKPQP